MVMVSLDKYIQNRKKHMARLCDLFDGKPADRPFVLSGVSGVSSADPYSEPEKWVQEAVDSLLIQTGALLSDKTFRPMVLEYSLYGVHFTDRLFGAEVFYSNGYWWSRKIRYPVGELPVPDLETNGTWILAKRLAKAMVDYGCEAPFICPQVLGAPFNQAFNLYKESLLTAFYDCPDKVRRDLSVITDTLCEMHKWYRANIPPEQFQPVVAGGRCQHEGFGQMCGCATQLISADIYNEFIADLDDKVLSLYPNGGMYHLCGSHTQHLDRWRKMERFRAFQLNDRAADDLEQYYNGLREDQIIYVNPTEAMTFGRIMEITGGRRIVAVTGEFNDI